MYEVNHLRAFSAAIAPGFTVYDIGANVGIYSLLASVKTGPSGKVYAFEPVQRNLHFLKRHVELNHLASCEIVAGAVSDTDGVLRFSSASWESSMGRLSPHGEIEVPSFTIDNCIYGEKNLRPPHVMKIDVEGAEKKVLLGAARTLAQFHPALFVEIHGTKLHTDCCEILRALGYHVEEEYGRLTATWAPPENSPSTWLPDSMQLPSTPGNPRSTHSDTPD